MIRFYMDENVHGAITHGLRRRGVDVRTAQGDIPASTPDELVLDRATELGRLLFSQDEDLRHDRPHIITPYRTRLPVPVVHRLRKSQAPAIRMLEPCRWTEWEPVRSDGDVT